MARRGTLGEQLDRARQRRFVGRRAELELFAAALSAPEPPFTVLHVASVALDTDDAGELFMWLRSLSFVEDSAHGLTLHDLARDMLDSDLRWREPTRYEELRHRLHEHLARPDPGQQRRPAAASDAGRRVPAPDEPGDARCQRLGWDG